MESTEKRNSGGVRQPEAANGRALSFLQPLPCLIFILYWLWINLGFQSTFFFSGTVLDGLLPLWALPPACAAVTYLGLAFSHRSLNRAFGTRRSVVFSSAILFAGILCGVLPYTDLSAAFGVLALQLASSLLVGAGTPLILMSIAQIFSLKDPYEVLLQTIAGALGAAPLCAATAFLESWHFLGLLLAIPVVLCLCMVCEIRRHPAQDAEPAVSNPKFPFKIVATSIVHGCALGVLFGLSDIVQAPVGNLFFLALAIACAAATLAVFALAVKVDYNSLIYRGAFVVIAAGAACFIVWPASSIGAFVQLFGFCLLHLIMWGLNCFLVHRFRIPILWLVGLSTAGCMAGEVVCGLATHLLSLRIAPNDLVAATECLLLLGLMVSSLFLSNAQNLKDGWSLVKPSNFRPAYGDFQMVCDQISSHYRLSQREAEVLSLFARGRNRKMIAEILVLSDETVKSHIQGIYRKTGTHSQQEIIDLVEVFQED